MPKDSAEPIAGPNRSRRPLIERLDSHFDVLVELRQLLRKRKPSGNECDSASESVTELVTALHHLISAAEKYFHNGLERVPVPQTAIDESRLARALLLAGTGSRFEPAILFAVREYRIAFENVRRYVNAELPQDIKTDVVARFRQQLDSANQALELLKVTPFEPDVHQPVVPGRHHVKRTVSTELRERVNLIAAVLSPGFEWIDDEGYAQVQAAEVTVYTLANLTIRNTADLDPTVSNDTELSAQTVQPEYLRSQATQRNRRPS